MPVDEPIPPLPGSASMEQFPFASLIGLELEHVERGRCAMGLTVDSRRHHNPQKVVHGSILHALADTSMGMALYTTLPDGQWCATIEIKVSYLRPVVEGRLKAVAEVVNRGKTIAHLEARVTQGNETLATASGSFAIFARPAGA